MFVNRKASWDCSSFPH